MIDPSAKLTVLHDDNGSFTDHTNDAADLTRDNFSMTLVAAEDYLYVGFFKPFGTLFAALTTPNTNANEFSAEIWDGSSWASVALTDESKGFTRSGYMFWERASMASTTVDSKTAYWLRLKPDADHTATTLRGINLIFADDAALKEEFFEIDNSSLYPTGESSHIAHHVAARNMIMQRLRNLQYIKTDADGNYVNMTQWDLFDLFEIKQAATMLALSKIFFLLSDNVDDQWWTKYREYQDKFEEAFGLARLSLDRDNDGIKDDNEVLRKTKVSRWVR